MVRAGGTEQAAAAVVDFLFRYGLSMELFKTKRAIQIVQERFVRAWELAGRPGTDASGEPARVADARQEVAANEAEEVHGPHRQSPPLLANPVPSTLTEQQVIAATVQKIHRALATLLDQLGPERFLTLVKQGNESVPPLPLDTPFNPLPRE